MSVNDWARWAKRRADEDGACGEPKSTVRSVEYKVGRVDGATEAFCALLSDEAVEAAKVAAIWALNGAEQIEDTAGNFWDVAEAVETALQAAVDAVTKEVRND